MKVSDVISRARTLLNDTDSANYRWSNAEMIDAINDAQKLIAVHRPDSCVTDTDLTLVNGVTQTLPAFGFRLMDVICNVSSVDNSEGRAITMIDRRELDTYSPSWRSGTKASVIENFMYDPRNPLKYEVYPPALAGSKVRATFSKHPVLVDDVNDDLTVTDVYFEHVLMFTMFRAYSKDMEFSGNAQLAAGYISLFNGLLGIKTNKDNAFAPAVNRKGAPPNVAAIQMGGV